MTGHCPHCQRHIPIYALTTGRGFLAWHRDEGLIRVCTGSEQPVPLHAAHAQEVLPL